MESEKVKEIKKALEHCGEKVTCQGCPEYNNEPVIDWFKCKKNLAHKTITLINHQDFQISTLKVQVANLEKELKKEQINHLYYRQDSQFKESRIAELEREKKEHGKKKFLRGWKLGTEELAERLKEKLKARHEVNRLLLMPVRDVVLSTIEGLLEDVDKTLKELINE